MWQRSSSLGTAPAELLLLALAETLFSLGALAGETEVDWAEREDSPALGGCVGTIGVREENGTLDGMMSVMEVAPHM